MLLKIAWRNVWRNKRRSLVVLTSVIVGVIAAIFMDAFQNGMLNQMLFNQVHLNTSHIQIHQKGFADNKVLQSYIPDDQSVDEVLTEVKGIEYYSKRVIKFGLLSSSNNSAGVYIYGVNPNHEKDVSMIAASIQSGKYLSGKDREIVIGNNLAEKLQVDVGDKVVAMADTPDGSLGSEVFRVVGLFSTPSSEFDKSYIYVPIKTAQRMLNIGNNYHEVAIITQNHEMAAALSDEIASKLSDNFEVLSYEKVLPMLVMMLQMYEEMVVYVNLIIAIALIFGIINAMLMAVFERIQEIGVLMSIGMKRWKIITMITFEALIIGVLGTLLGLLLGYLLMEFVMVNGLDLSTFAEGLNSYGVGAIIYPKLSIENIISLLIMMPFISIIGGLYPAYKAIKLEPVQAIRYV